LTLFAIELPSIFNQIVDCLRDATPFSVKHHNGTTSPAAHIHI
jgi:hypothetical protein